MIQIYLTLLTRPLKPSGKAFLSWSWVSIIKKYKSVLQEVMYFWCMIITSCHLRKWNTATVGFININVSMYLDTALSLLIFSLKNNKHVKLSVFWQRLLSRVQEPEGQNENSVWGCWKQNISFVIYFYEATKVLRDDMFYLVHTRHDLVWTSYYLVHHNLRVLVSKLLSCAHKIACRVRKIITWADMLDFLYQQYPYLMCTR